MYKHNLNVIYDAITEDEYYLRTHPLLRQTLYYIIFDIKHYGTCSIESLRLKAEKKNISFHRIIADIIKLIYLGYITLSDDQQDKLYVGSKKLDEKITDENWLLKLHINKTKSRNFQKKWLNSNIIYWDENSLIRGGPDRTIENIYENDPEFIFNEILNQRMILSLSSVNILEKRFNYKFPEIVKKHLLVCNEIYELRNNGEKIQHLSDYLKIMNKPNLKEYQNVYEDFIYKLNLKKIRYLIDNDEILILDNFYLDDEYELPSNLTIYGSLIITDLLKNKNIIPQSIKVHKYVQFGNFVYPDIPQLNVDVFLNLNNYYDENILGYKYI